MNNLITNNNIKSKLILIFILTLLLILLPCQKVSANMASWASKSYKEVGKMQPSEIFKAFDSLSYTDNDDDIRVGGKYANFLCLEKNKSNRRKNWSDEITIYYGY